MTALTAPLDPETYADEPTPLWVAAVAAHDVAIIARRVAASRPQLAVVSKSPSARYGVPCPTCKVAADQPCRTRTTGRVTDTHAARIKASR